MTPPQTQFCPACGVQAAPGSKFCPGCGAATQGPGLTNFTRVRQLFDIAQSIDPGQRDAWLESACQGDTAMLAELRSMFRPVTGGPFRDPVPSLPPVGSAVSATASTGLVIGPYRVIRELGRGGMGVVFLAVRDDGAFRKNVALKLLLRDQVTAEFVARFKQERQVLAALDHPNIARILDGGDAPDGMPYYVMEYVEGLPLDVHCEQHRLSLTGRIKVFQQVCLAVDYLHKNLVVHRDLKPGNIIVSTDGSVKLLDFGIAKVVGAAAYSAQELTSALGRPMTPSYASPEQIHGAATLQPASDIYSAGVILYRLLTGRTPYQDLDEKIAKLAARIDPPLPSANIREDLRASPESTAQLRRAMLGAIDGIVLKSMRFDPKERYQSAQELANDLQRFLDGESVTAHHDSVANRSMKLIRRKRAGIAVLAGFLILAGFGLWQWRRAESHAAEAAAKLAQVGRIMEGFESDPTLAAPPPKGEEAANIIPKRLEAVSKLRKSFAEDFTAAITAKPGPSPERDALLDRGVQYLDRLRKASPADPRLTMEIAETYLQFGALREASAAGDRQQAAVPAYRKAAEVLSGYCLSNPTDTGARQRLDRVNQRLQALNAAPASIPAAGQGVGQAADQPPDAIANPTKVVTGGATTRRPPEHAHTGTAEDLPAQRAPVALPPKPTGVSPAVREAEDRLATVTSVVKTAEAAIEPVRRNLAAQGQTLSPNIQQAMSNMRIRLEQARRDLASGDVAAAQERMAQAEAFAARVQGFVGR